MSNIGMGVENMELQLIESKTSHHPGYGAGSGEVIREEYKCPAVME
jgi:hypothetical protein